METPKPVPKKKTKHKKIEFSKMLAVIVTILFVASILFSFIVWFVQDRIPGELLGYVAAPFGVVVSGYFVKAGIENYQKINQYQYQYQPQSQQDQYNEETY